MVLAPTLERYLARKHVDYDLVSHSPTTSAMPIAELCLIPPERLAKGVVVRTKESYVLVVLPASHRIRHAELKEQLGEDFTFATEMELDQLFADCAHGAVPPVGECYGLDVLVEASLREQPDVYFEGGDHVTVVHMSGTQFAQLIGDARHGCFGAPAASTQSPSQT